MTALEDVFPENPLISSIDYAFATKQPITIPWSQRTIALGSGVRSSEIEGGNPLRQCAFTGPYTALYRSSSSGLVITNAVDTSGSASERLAVSFAARVGTKYLNASVKGNYEKGTEENRDDVSDNFRAEYRSGCVLFNSAAGMSDEALQLLRQYPQTPGAFESRYGDYYVAGLYLGASNGTMLSGSSSLTRSYKALAATVTAKVLWVEKSKGYEESESASSFDGSLSLNAYDTLIVSHDDETAHDTGGIQRLTEAAAVNRVRGWALQNRVSKGMQTQGMLRDGQVVSEAQCRILCESGLVYEVLLLPYSSNREYLASLARYRCYY